MPDESASPFTGLDKALLRSTRPPASPPEEETPARDAAKPRRSATSTPRRSSERSDVRSNERTNERTKIRHSFDIYRDQLLELADIQADIFRRTGKKPKVGDLVQEALDAYIAQRRRAT